MGFWSNVETLRALSHALMWITGVCAVLAALATGTRYYVDRQVSRLSAELQRTELEQKEEAQGQREAQLRLQLRAADQTAREADAKAAAAAAAAEELRLAQIPRVDLLRRHRAAFLRALGSGGATTPVILESPMGNAEAREMAQQLKQWLLEAGWSADGAQSVYTGAPRGLSLFGDPNLPDRGRFASALAAAGFSPEVHDSTGASGLRVLVGQK